MNLLLVITHAIQAQLLDPASAQFRLDPVRPQSEYYCGLVNAKNRMGGYNGFEPFLARLNPDRSLKVVVLPSAAANGDRDAYETVWLPLVVSTCTKEGYSIER